VSRFVLLFIVSLLLQPSQAVETEHNTDTGYVDETIEDYMHINIELATGQ